MIPYYNSYFADTWHVRPSVTISYGLSYQLEMPPHEANSRQVMTVFQDGSPVVAADYMAQRSCFSGRGRGMDVSCLQQFRGS